MAKKKYTKNLDTIQGRISVLRWEIEKRREELAELATELEAYELSVSLDLRTLKDEGIVPAPLFSV